MAHVWIVLAPRKPCFGGGSIQGPETAYFPGFDPIAGDARHELSTLPFSETPKSPNDEGLRCHFVWENVVGTTDDNPQ